MNKFAKYVPEEDKKKQREFIGIDLENMGGSPFKETVSENLFQLQEVDDAIGDGLFMCRITGLNLHDKYTIVVRGDRYENLPPRYYDGYYDFYYWGTYGVEGGVDGLPDGIVYEYPINLTAQYTEGNGWHDLTGEFIYENTDYHQIFIGFDSSVYPDLDPSEVQVYRTDIDCLDPKYIPGDDIVIYTMKNTPFPAYAYDLHSHVDNVENVRNKILNGERVSISFVNNWRRNEEVMQHYLPASCSICGVYRNDGGELTYCFEASFYHCHSGAPGVTTISGEITEDAIINYNVNTQYITVN